MRIAFTPGAWEDYTYWQRHDPAMLVKVNDLIREVRRMPFKGVGKPEPLKHQLSGWWSRRITAEHRLIYRITGAGETQTLEIAACRYHY